MKRFLPSNLFWGIALPIASLVALGGLYYVLEVRQDTNTNSIIVQNPEEVLHTYVAEADTDGDGLPDWEESLWKFDPKAKDSDGDGTPDGREAQLQTASAPVNSHDIAQATTLTASTSATDILAKDLFGTYLALKQTGSLNDETKDQLVKKVVDNTLTQLVPPKYTLLDLHVDPSVDIEIYKTNLLTIFDPLRNVKTNEFYLLIQIVQNNDPAARQQYESNLAIYHTVQDNLKTMPVPQEVSEAHLAVLNSMSTVIFSLEGMVTLKDDPIRASASASIYLKAEKEFQTALTQLNSLLI